MSTILFDLGNTLVSYYEREEFPGILDSSLRAAHGSLFADGYRGRSVDDVLARVGEALSDPDDLSVRPLDERFETLFGLAEAGIGLESIRRAARAFVEPLQAPAAAYPDTIPALDHLRDAGWRIGIVSNLPFGVPADLWRGELARHGIDAHLDFAIFCTDVGFRKPSPRIFRAAIERLGVPPAESVFVGDEPVWDVAGAERAGIPAVLMDRRGRHTGHGGARVTTLPELLDRIGLPRP